MSLTFSAFLASWKDTKKVGTRLRLLMEPISSLFPSGDQAVCLGDPLPTTDHGYPEVRTESAEGISLPQCFRFLHLELCSVPGKPVILMAILSL